MPDNVFKWQLYIAAYTASVGLPLLLFPTTALPLMGFDPALAASGPFVQLTGMLFLGLTMVTVLIWQKKIAKMVVGTVFLRLFIIITLFVLGNSTDSPFLFMMIPVVAIGIIGTLWSLRRVNLKEYI